MASVWGTSWAATAWGNSWATLAPPSRGGRTFPKRLPQQAAGDRQRRAFATIDVTESPDAARFDVLSDIVAGVDAIEASDGVSIDATLTAPASFEVREIADGFDATAKCESWAERDNQILFLP